MIFTRPVFFYFALFILASAPFGQLEATEIKIGKSDSDLLLDQSNTVTNVSPSGTHFTLTQDIGHNWRVSLDYIDWEVNQAKLQKTKVDNQSYAATIYYFYDDFVISANYTHWQSQYHGKIADITRDSQKTTAPSYGIAFARTYFTDNWLIEPAISVQYNQWRTRQHGSSPNEVSFDFLDNLEDETFVLSALITASKVIELSKDQFVLLGSVFRWNQLFSAEQRQPQFSSAITGRRGLINSNDESFAELSLFATYDITPNWMIEVDTSYAFLDTAVHSSLSWRIGYRF